MSTRGVVHQGVKALHDHQGEIVKSAALVGFCVTTYLTAVAAFRVGAREAARTKANTELGKRDVFVRTRLSYAQELAERHWREAVPPALAAVFTVTCMVRASQIDTNRAATALTAYSLGERAMTEYRAKVAERLGEKDEAAIHDEIRTTHVAEHPPSSDVVVTEGKVLCCDRYTGRYFESSMEEIRRAENLINHGVIHERYVTLNEFYALVELPDIPSGADLGWDSDRLLEIDVTTALAPDDTPCLIFDFNYIKPL